MSTGENKTVCVTGASGYIASWLVKLLLRRGYTVKATVRDLDDPKKTQHLLSLDGANERLQLFKADLLEEGSFDSAVDGCIGVFHTASPVSLTPSDPQAELIDPAVKGTLNVLKSCAKALSVRRVVVTSSIAAVVYTEKPPGRDDMVDETWFSDPSFCERSKLWYMLSKTLAEDASWRFAKETGTDLVTLHPSLVIGPLLQPNFNLSTQVILLLVTGKMPFLHTTFRYIDVRDVAFAHIQAFEIASASGRYILDGTVINSDEMFKIFHEFNPDLKFTKLGEDDGGLMRLNYNVSMEKAESLGIDFISAETSLRDTIQSLKEKGFF